ncbi:TPM domain-containing protein [Orbus sturtevantii]|uniref:TPM domain-containing protein n=1 Tax=Orbus sturtevantii TaxID=3074109 RepID=UPI00370DD136
MKNKFQPRQSLNLTSYYLMRFVLLWFIGCLFISYQVLAMVGVPAYSQRVVDTTNTLTDKQIEQLDKTLRNYESTQDTGSQIAILLVPTLDNEPIEQFADRVFKLWQIGKKGNDNGILFVIAKNDRQVRIEVGYGLEGYLTDLAAKHIIEHDFIPALKQNSYYHGINDALTSIISMLAKIDDSASFLQQSPNNMQHEWRVGDVLSSPFGMKLLHYSIASYVICLLVVNLFLFKWLKKSKGRKHFAIGILNGCSAGSYTLLEGFSISVVLSVLFLVFVASTILSALPSKNDTPRGGRGKGGNGFGGGFSSRGRFGGGGGGRSGGGGASGRW